jgi:phospholipid/cholesterol/gamma-HCH transport system ATP-binding protein
MASAEKTPIIRVEGLSARYEDATIFEGVDLQIFKGEILVILGESGCGKSTLLKHMFGLYRPYAGRVLIEGVDIALAGAAELRDLRRRIGILFQSGALFGSMTLAENVALPLLEYRGLPPGIIRLIVKMKLGMVNLAGYENHLPSELSGGMKKRAALARAIALDPTVLFFDEPTAGLDPVTAAEIDNLIKEINAGMGTTMVIVTQELASIFNIAQRVIMLDKTEKGIIAEGDPRYLKEHSTDLRVTNFFNRRAAEQKAKGI